MHLFFLTCHRQLKVNNSAAKLYSEVVKAKYVSIENTITCEHILDERSLSKGKDSVQVAEELSLFEVFSCL